VQAGPRESDVFYDVCRHDSQKQLVTPDELVASHKKQTGGPQATPRMTCE